MRHRYRTCRRLAGASRSAGKSTFLEALAAVRGVVNGLALATVLPQGSLAWWDRRVLQTFELEFDDPVGDKKFRYRLRVRHSESGPPMVDEESVVCDGTPLLTFAKKRVTIFAEDGTAQSFAFEGGHSPLSAGMGDNSQLSRCRVLFLGVSMFKLNPWSMVARSTGESGRLNTDGSNFIDWVRGVALDDPEGFSRWQANLKMALPHIQSLRLQDLGAGSRLLTGMMSRPDNAEQPIPFYDFSEGEKCLAVLHAVAVTRGRNVVLSLDEPEASNGRASEFAR